MTADIPFFETGVFNFSQSYYNVSEGNGTVQITVIRVEGDDQSHGLKWDVTAVDGNDYVGEEKLVNMKKVSLTKSIRSFIKLI